MSNTPGAEKEAVTGEPIPVPVEVAPIASGIGVDTEHEFTGDHETE